jgi:predicted nucleotidyltransferase
LSKTSSSKCLFSVVMFGSYVRGDFVDGVSDLDFFAVIRRNEGCIPKLKIVLE